MASFLELLQVSMPESSNLVRGDGPAESDVHCPVVMASGCRSERAGRWATRRPSTSLRAAPPEPHGAPAGWCYGSSPHQPAGWRRYSSSVSTVMVRRSRRWPSARPPVDWCGCRLPGGEGPSALLRSGRAGGPRCAPHWGQGPQLSSLAMRQPSPARRLGGVPGGIRTHTVGGLSSVSLPVGIRGQCHR